MPGGNHVPTDISWEHMDESDRRWVIEGEADWSWDSNRGGWYGVQRFFDFLETRSYKMHIRVPLSRYRSYDQCLASATWGPAQGPSPCSGGWGARKTRMPYWPRNKALQAHGRRVFR